MNAVDRNAASTQLTASARQTKLLRSVFMAAALLAGCGTNLQPRTVQMEGRAVEVVTLGAGPGTVVFEAGFGNDWTPWDGVASEVSRHARVFAYSRPGYGQSTPTTTTREPATIVEELRALLRAQGYTPPYVLVGHSFGGTYMELFARSYPNEVSGVVLVDPRHRDFLSKCEQAGIAMCGIPEPVVETLPAVQIAEYRAFAATSQRIGAAGAFGPYPVRVLTATEHAASAPWEALWKSMLASLAAEAPQGKETLFQGAGHFLHLERTGEVAKAIIELLPKAGH